MPIIKITDDEMDYAPGEKVLSARAQRAWKQARAMLEKEKREQENEEKDRG